MHLARLIDIAQTYYKFNEQDRPYHNHQHALAVARDVVLTADKEDDALILAAHWHDAVYIPGARGDANEQCSAAALLKAASKLDDAATVEKAAQLIRYTSVQYHLHTNVLAGDIACLLDADLSSLAAPYGTFIHNQKNIINEQGGTAYEHDKAQSSAFLSQFLRVREFIYHTEYGRLNWEKTARDNITRYIEETTP